MLHKLLFIYKCIMTAILSPAKADGIETVKKVFTLIVDRFIPWIVALIIFSGLFFKFGGAFKVHTEIIEWKCAKGFTKTNSETGLGKPIPDRPYVDYRKYYEDGEVCDVDIELSTQGLEACKSEGKNQTISISCPSVRSDSTKDFLSGWRRSLFAKLLTELTNKSNPLIFVVVFTLLLFSTSFSLVLCLSFCFRFFPSIYRGVVITISLANSPRTSCFDFSSKDDRKSIVQVVSDLHITEIGEIPHEVYEDPTIWRTDQEFVTVSRKAKSWPSYGPVGPDTYTRTRKLFNLMQFESKEPTLLAITGDITDSGTEQQWKQFELAISAFDETQNIGLVPGNHDISFHESNSPNRKILSTSSRRDNCLKLYKEYLKKAEKGDWLGFDTNSLLLTPYPRYLNLRGIHVVCLDSNTYHSNHILSNAIGKVGSCQLRKLSDRLKIVTGPLLLLIHHHPTKPKISESPFPTRVQDFYTGCLDSRKLIKILRKYTNKSINTVLIVHGHRHKEYMQQYSTPENPILVYGVPSSSMGKVIADINGNNTLDGVLNWTEIGLNEKGQWWVRKHQK